MKPRIVCTLGTTTDYDSVLEKMIQHGMTGVRMNTAYATIPEYNERIDQVKKFKPDIKVMMDVKGPQVRLGEFPFQTISKDKEILVGFPDEFGRTRNMIYFNKDFYSDLKVGDCVLFENGTIESQVIAKYGQDVRLRIIEPGDGILHKYMGVNVPGTYLNVDKLSQKDKDVIAWGMEKGIDQIALSFTRDISDLKNCYDYMKSIDEEKAKKTEINLKIEDKFGVENLNNILDYAKKEDINVSVMVARGDLFVELGPAELPLAQEYIVKTCQKKEIDVMVGTGILDSMNQADRPTRAETTDIYNILKSGVNYFMLSGETSNSKHPALVVETLKKSVDRFYENQAV